MTAEVANVKHGLTRIPTYSELIREIDKEKIKTNEIRRVLDRNAWFYHESPLNTAPNENSNTHPADLQQQNFKRMVQEAVVPETTVFNPNDEDEMEEMRDDAIDLYEKSFEKEQEMREEEDRKIAEQVSLSHRADYHDMNRTIFDSVGSTDSASAGIEEDEVKHSVLQHVINKAKENAKPLGKKLLKEATKAIAVSQGGVVGGLIADRLLDTSGEAGQEKKSLAKTLGTKVATSLADAILPDDVEKKPKAKAKGTKKDLVKPNRSGASSSTTKVLPTPKRRTTKKSPPEEEEVEYMDTRAGSQKRENTTPQEGTAKKPNRRQTREPKPKRMEILNVDAETTARAQAKAKASASSSSAQPTAQEEHQETKGVKKTIHKAVLPSKAGIQVMREAFEDAHNKKVIDVMTYREYEELFNQWKSSKKEEKKERLNQLRQMYKSKLYPKLKQK